MAIQKILCDSLPSFPSFQAGLQEAASFPKKVSCQLQARLRNLLNNYSFPEAPACVKTASKKIETVSFPMCGELKNFASKHAGIGKAVLTLFGLLAAGYFCLGNGFLLPSANAAPVPPFPRSNCFILGELADSNSKGIILPATGSGSFNNLALERVYCRQNGVILNSQVDQLFFHAGPESRASLDLTGTKIIGRLFITANGPRVEVEVIGIDYFPISWLTERYRYEISQLPGERILLTGTQIDGERAPNAVGSQPPRSENLVCNKNSKSNCRAVPLTESVDSNSNDLLIEENNAFENQVLDRVHCWQNGVILNSRVDELTFHIDPESRANLDLTGTKILKRLYLSANGPRAELLIKGIDFLPIGWNEEHLWEISKLAEGILFTATRIGEK